MKKSLIPLTVVAVSAAAFVGCEWGGVHRGESWNDAYAWANFSGTYKLASSISSDGSSDASSGLGTDGFSKNYTFNGNNAYYAGHAALVPGSVSVSLGSVSFKDDENDVSEVVNGANKVTINHSSGMITVTMANDNLYKGKALNINGKYKISSTSSASSGGNVVDSPITWINVTQKGNLLTMEDNNGTIYSGKITGASCPTADSEGYVQAAHIRFPFEATSSNGKVTLSGSLSGDWSGSSSETTGTLSNRTLDGNYHKGKTTIQFMAVSGTVTLITTAI